MRRPFRGQTASTLIEPTPSLDVSKLRLNTTKMLSPGGQPEYWLLLPVNRQSGIPSARQFRIMDDGIYSVSLKHEDEPLGGGVLVLRDGTMNGGGPGYLWTGFYDHKRESVSCDIWAYQKSEASIFGDKDQYTLSLKRDRQPGKLTFSGSVDHDPNRVVTVEFVWQRRLAQ
jgi:T3SS negative regulator,GrlR